MALLATVVRRTLKGLTLTPADAVVTELALTYAKRIDEDAAQLGKLGPQLLAVLDSLQMTPRSRAAASKGGAPNGRPANPLDQLRARRAARVNGPAAVDTATS